MRLEQLQYLLEIERTHSMNMAGENLHISQQAISTAIKLLERELQAQLLVRTPKGVYLTKAGEKAVQAAADILARIELLKSEVVPDQDSVKPLLVILVHAGMLRSMLAPKMPLLYAGFSAYQLRVLSSSLGDILDKLSAQEAQLGLVYAFDEDIKAIQRRGLLFFPIETFKFGACVSQASPLAQHKKLTIKELIQRYPVMAFEESNSENNMVQRVLKKCGVENIANCIAVNEEGFAQMIAKDLAAGLGFQSRQNRLMENAYSGVFIPLTENIVIHSGYIVTAENSHSIILEQFKQLLAN